MLRSALPFVASLLMAVAVAALVFGVIETAVSRQRSETNLKTSLAQQGVAATRITQLQAQVTALQGQVADSATARGAAEAQLSALSRQIIDLGGRPVVVIAPTTRPPSSPVTQLPASPTTTTTTPVVKPLTTTTTVRSVTTTTVKKPTTTTTVKKR